MNRILWVATVAGACALASGAKAQYRAVGDDGIAASPKLRQKLDERRTTVAIGAAETPVMVSQGRSDDEIIGSPKANETLTPPMVPVVFSTGGDVSYKPVGDDGIAASPKVRQLLNERKMRFETAVEVRP